MDKDNSKEKIEVPKKRSLGMKLLRGAMWLVALFVLLLAIVTILFRMESFQNYAVQKLTNKLSKDLETKVEISHIDFEIFDKLVLDSFYLEDLHGDTLLFSEKLVIDFGSSLFSLVKGNLKVNSLTLQNAKLNLERKEGEPKDNLNQILAKLFPPKDEPPTTDKKEKKPFYLEADFLHLENLTFEQNDEIKGELVYVYVNTGTIKVDEIDLENKTIVVESAHFKNSKVQLDSYDKKPLPIDTTAIAVEEVESEDADSLYKPFRLLIHDFDYVDGQYSMHNYRKSPVKKTLADELDLNHLELFNVNIAVDSFKMADVDFAGQINNISCQDSSGFVLEKLSSPDAIVTERRLQLNGVELVTPYSNVQDTIILKYKNFKSFNNFVEEINMDLRLDNSKVAIKDVMAFARKLKTNKFFANNSEEVIRLDGTIKGRANKLRGENLKLVIGRNTIIEGDFSSRDLANKGNESLNLELKRLKTNVKTLRQLIPNFNPPANFDKLGNIDFSGRFDGFFVDFVAYGDLKTDLGSANLDMRLDLKQGKEDAKYSGELNLLNFDLATWTGNQQVGNITVTSKISDGIGITGSTANAKINANINQFTFKDYTYHDFKMDGQLDSKSFDGDFVIRDENIDLTFNGIIDFRDSIPDFDFKAKVNTLNLDELNLAKQDLSISGEMDLKIQDINISNLTGDASCRNIVMIKDGNEKYQIDTLSFFSNFQNGNRIFSAKSEIFEGEIVGQYDIQEVPDAFVLFVEKNYPEISERFGIKAKRQNLKSRKFDFDIKILNSKNFTHLIDSKLDTIKNFMVKGDFDGENYIFNMDLAVEELTYAQVEIGGIKWNSNALRSTGQLVSLIPFYAIINGKNKIPELNIDSRLNKDTIQFQIGVVGERGTYDKFNIGGKLFFEDGGFNISLSSDSLMLFGEEWTISENNFLQLGKKFFETNSFILKNRDRVVSIKDIEQKGLHLRLDNFNTGFIDSIWNYQQMDFAGNYSVDIKANDIYKFKDFEAKIQSDTFWVNGDDWGELTVDATLANLKNQANAKLVLQRGLRELSIDGYYILPTTEILEGKAKTFFSKKSPDPNYFNFNLDMINYPLNIAEYFIGKHTSNIEGLVDIQAAITGFPKKVESNGLAQIYNGGITVDYLNTRYVFGNDKPTEVKISSSLFDFGGNYFTDKYGNKALVTGGISHQNFKQPGLDARITSDRLLVLDTDKFDNKLYYGHAIGEVDGKFTGRFQYNDVKVNATPGKGSELFIPVNYDQTADESSFIIFRNEQAKEEERGISDVRGMDVELNINMNENAEMSLIFDERAGDIIKGKGNGPLTMKVPRSGDITLAGEYVIAEGEYLFTMYNIVNKKFYVEPGGTINWNAANGDPFAAQIDLHANYDRLSTSVYNFIQEYIELGVNDLKAQSRKPTDVDLRMNLTGDLLKPDINFDFTFPNLVTGDVKNYVDTKLRTLRQDQNELNRQVFGLIVIGGFLPTGQETLAGTEITASSINTVSEYVSHRLSIYMTELLSEAFSELGVVSGVDFDMSYNVYDGGELQLGSATDPILVQGSEMQININPRFKNDKFSLNGGIVRSTETATGTFIGGDFAAEYFLTEDRRFKVRFYHRTGQDVDGSRRDRTGIGINYRRQFNTFGDFLNGMKKAAKDSVKGSKVNN